MSIIKTIIFITFFTSTFSVKYSSKYRDRGQLWTPKFNPPNENNNLIFNVSRMFEQAGKEYTQENIAEIVSKNLDYGSNSVEEVWPIKVFNCVGSMGVLECLKIFLARRVERISELVQRSDGNRKVSMNFENINSELEDFKWEKYSKFKESELDAIIYKNMRNLIHTKKIKVILYPGVSVDSAPTGNGTVNVDIKKDKTVDLSRGMKFPKKGFYRIVPMLLIPPLIMSAILPFVLPAMKMIIIGAGLLNQVALWGAVITLMRNNVFQDSYEKKVIYVNSGYNNEKKPPPIIHHPILHEPLHHAIIPTKKPFISSPPIKHYLPQVSTAGYDDDDDSDEDEEFDGHEEVFNSFKYGNSHFQTPSQSFFDERLEHRDRDRDKYSPPHFSDDYNNRRDKIVQIGGRY